ncbi:MAG TPA: HlyD family efflux transporter periplasmic adaptor subunit [Vicinamibacterales bacterium]
MKILLVLVVLIAALAVGGFFWTRQKPVVSAQLILHGNVDIRQVSLAFDGSGRIAEMHAEEGDVVKAGTVLARLDTRTLALQADQAAAQIQVQEQTLRRVRVGPRPQEIEQARSRLAAAQSDQSRAQEDLTRLQGISSKTQGRGVSTQDLDRARSAVQTASAHTDEAREALRLLEAGSRAEDIGAAEAQVKASRAQLALLRHQIELGELTAPVDAVVRSRLLEPGDMATPQRPVFALALTQPKWVRVYIAEPDLGKVRDGMTARVLTDSSPDALTGKVSFIASTAEFTPKSVETEQLRTSLVYEVRILVDDTANLLRLGQPVTVQLPTGS